MRKCFLIQVVIFGFMGSTITQSSAQSDVPQLEFDAEVFGKLPEDIYLGEASGVAVNSKGHVFIFSRGNSTGPAYGASAAQLLEFMPDGRFVREIGHNLYAWSYAHTVRVDSSDNVWAVDKGSDTVVKFSPEGRVVMVFGRKPEASDEAAHPLGHPNPPLSPIDGMFRQVTDVTWDPQGNTYISDGYINSRIAKYDAEGNWLGSFGGPGTLPGQFNTPHAIAADKDGNIFVADRGNRRVQVLDGNGKFVRAISIDLAVPADTPTAIGNKVPGPTNQYLPGAPWALCITPAKAGSPQYLFVADAFPGRIYKMSLEGKLLGWLGGAGKSLKKFGWIHELACVDEKTLFAAEVLNWRVQKLSIR